MDEGGGGADGRRLAQVFRMGWQSGAYALVARNRFYQVPHCNGMGHRAPSGMAAMRRVKAEGGWAMVCTEACEIHPSADISPHTEARLWDDRDMPALARAADAIHEFGSLAGIELGHHGFRAVKAPGTIAAAVFSGHRYAREFDRPKSDRMPFVQEVAELGSWSRTHGSLG
jgi:2,4-dienoyl-CoA reductase-like NADH-dependent reductase (Old Yellow Enzyme family)